MCDHPESDVSAAHDLLTEHNRRPKYGTGLCDTVWMSAQLRWHGTAAHRPIVTARAGFYLSAQTAMQRPGPNRDYYLKNANTAEPTAKPSSPWPDGASMSSGRSYATTEPGRAPRQWPLRPLDNTIEIPSGPARSAVSAGRWLMFTTPRSWPWPL